MRTLGVSTPRPSPPDAPPFHLRVLGPVTVTATGTELSAAPTLVTQPRPLALLLYLALARPRGLQPRDTLLALLWPEHDATRARRGLRNALHALRHALDPRAIITAGEGFVGLDTRWVSCDAHTLERGCHGSTGPDATEAGGVEPLHGLHVADAAPFDRWLDAERARLRGVLVRPPASTRMPSAAATPYADWRVPDGPHGVDAFSWFLRGHYCFLRAAHDGEPTTLQQARRSYERALAVHPRYAAAVAGMSNYWAIVARRELGVPFQEAWTQCLAYAHQTLALSSDIGVPHVHFGTEALYQRDDFARAGDEFACAIDKEPTNAEAHRFRAIWLALMDRLDEAVVSAERAVALEPDIVMPLNTLGAIRLQAGDLIGAERALRATLEVDPRQAPARERLLRLLERQERFADAVAERLNGPASLRGAAFAEAWETGGDERYRAARRDELAAELERIEAQVLSGRVSWVTERYTPPVLRLVTGYAELGAWTRVRAWRLQATATRPGLSRWFDVIPELRGGAEPSRQVPDGRTSL